jgi:hypothetical protein
VEQPSVNEIDYLRSLGCDDVECWLTTPILPARERSPGQRSSAGRYTRGLRLAEFGTQGGPGLAGGGDRDRSGQVRSDVEVKTSRRRSRRSLADPLRCKGFHSYRHGARGGGLGIRCRAKTRRWGVGRG